MHNTEISWAQALDGLAGNGLHMCPQASLGLVPQLHQSHARPARRCKARLECSGCAQKEPKIRCVGIVHGVFDNAYFPRRIKRHTAHTQHKFV